jgi:hypothetical protein
MILTITATTYLEEQANGAVMPESGSFEIELTNPPEADWPNGSWRGNLIMEGDIYNGMDVILNDFLEHGLEVRVVEESYRSYKDSYWPDRVEKITTYKVVEQPTHHRIELNNA